MSIPRNRSDNRSSLFHSWQFSKRTVDRETRSTKGHRHPALETSSLRGRAIRDAARLAQNPLVNPRARARGRRRFHVLQSGSVVASAVNCDASAPSETLPDSTAVLLADDATDAAAAACRAKLPSASRNSCSIRRHASDMIYRFHVRDLSLGTRGKVPRYCTTAKTSVCMETKSWSNR